MGLMDKLFGTRSEREVKRLEPTVKKIEALAEPYAALSNAELQDEYFMMRVRFDGGRADPAKLRAVGEISRDYARSTADFTDRQNIQLHWIQIEDVPTFGTSSSQWG